MTEPEAPRRGAMTVVGTVAVLLVALGALNWALVGFANFDAIDALLGRGSVVARAVYLLIGAAGVYCLVMLPRWSSAG